MYIGFMKRVIVLIVTLALFGLAASIFAVQYVAPAPGSTGIGEVAANMTTPISAVRYAFNAACYILGAGFLVATLFRYSRFRQNPQEAPMSSIITLLIIALVLIILPLSYDLSHYWATNQGIDDVLPKS